MHAALCTKAVEGLWGPRAASRGPALASASVRQRLVHMSRWLLMGQGPSPATGAGTDSSINKEEVAKFGALSGQWWSRDGAFKSLHQINHIRLGYIRSVLESRLQLVPGLPKPFKGSTVLDIGCGGGLLSEPMARLGATLLGVDPAPDNIRAAQAHAHMSRDLDGALSFQCTTCEAVEAEGRRFDVVLASEVIEHVNNPAVFVKTCSKLAKDGGTVFFSSVNRTPWAFSTVVVAAEYLAGYVPRGTHDYEHFVKPEELAALAVGAGLDVVDVSGINYSPLRDQWSVGSDLSANYIMATTRTRAPDQ